MSDEWGPWIEHDGKGCPCVGMWVRAEFVDNPPMEAWAKGGRSWYWSNVRYLGPVCVNGQADPLIRYRIRRPRALLQLIEMVENLPARTPAKEDA